MNILFIHQNFPGQFIHLSAELAKDKKNRVVALGMSDRPVPQNVELRRYSMLRSANPETHPLLIEQESHVLRAEACASAAFQLKRDGFIPDLIVAHPGWGEALFIKDVFPTAKLVIYCEYYYALEGQDVGFDPETPPLNFHQQAKLRLKNTTNLLSLQIAEAAISPTEWQKLTYPQWARDKISVIHDGIDTALLKFNPKARLHLQQAGRGTLELRPGSEVISYVARNLEPVRGFHIFMRTLPQILELRPNAQVVIVGGDSVSYGSSPPDGSSWKTFLLKQMRGQIDVSRLHFVGKIPYSVWLDLLSISRVHTYWTTPFVLSWSFLEAALSGVPVVCSNTAPVQEFEHIPSVSMSNFFDTNAFAEKVINRLVEPVRFDLSNMHSTFDKAASVKQQCQYLQQLI